MEKTKYQFIVVLCLFILLAITSLTLLYIEPSNCIDYFTNIFSDNEMNKINNTKPYLWVYWELKQGVDKAPPYIDLCIKTIKRNGSKYFNVVILNDKTVKQYLPDLRNDINQLPLALKADYIRVNLLEKYGGLWMDADVIVVNDLKLIRDEFDKGTDFIGFGCTGYQCTNGYGRMSNGVMGSKKHGKLIAMCKKRLDEILNENKMNKKEFGYFDLGKLVIWDQYDKLMKLDPSYKYKQFTNEVDGTRDKNDKWIAKDYTIKNNIDLKEPNKLMFVMLANSTICGDDKEYNWFCQLEVDEFITKDLMINNMFRKAFSV